MAWKPVPKPTALGLAKRYWLLILLLTIAFGGLLWLRRDAIAESLFGPDVTEPGVERDADVPTVD